ncbi:hypothetical protein [Thalassobacillus sp. CUG 92003]|uniref:hypothetical protein n=1 Tax=Thalassobacillus sp. CUG 92003 TaxID=2736641 RepID=UPI0015E7A506|nr:hypothetical protein [Thalassobacillus sp. CUG 92003]
MLKTLAATGMAISIGMAGVGSVSAAEDANTSVDLQTKVETAIDEGETVTKANLQAWAETNDWEVEDLQAFAKTNGTSHSSRFSIDSAASNKISTIVSRSPSCTVNLLNKLNLLKKSPP